jgi:hypothetical protein
LHGLWRPRDASLALAAPPFKARATLDRAICLRSQRRMDSAFHYGLLGLKSQAQS